MPSLGADMDAGTVSKWMVKPGDEVHRGDIVAVVETEKSTIEVEIFESGVIEEILVPEGEQVAVGTVLARVATAAIPAPGRARGGQPAAKAPAPKQAEPKARARREKSTAKAPVGGEEATPKARARARPASQPPPPPPGRAASAEVPALVTSPMVRHLAEVRHVDLTRVTGSGPGGSVTRADVEHAGPATGARVRSSPFARRLAADLGVDLAAVVGTGPAGAVLEADVRRAAEARPAPEAAAPAPPRAESPAAGVADRQAGLRRAIGALMARSKREIPHYYLSTTVDMSRASAWMAESNLDRPVPARLVMPVLMLKATALAVAEVPEMNGFMPGEEFEPSVPVHVGVAISLRSGGVIAPAIHDAETLPLDDLMAALRDLVTRARRGVLRSSEMSDPTITVSNLGDLGVDEVYGVIYPPQVALVGFGRVVERPWASGGMVGARPCVKVTLSADHRVSDGHRGGIFLAAIDRLLQQPEEL